MSYGKDWRGTLEGHKMNLRTEFRSNKTIEKHIATLLRDDRERYKNRSHVIRVAIMRLNDETYEHRRRGIISSVCKGIRARIQRGNDDKRDKIKDKTKAEEKPKHFAVVN